MHDLIALEIFVAPPQKLEEGVVRGLGDRIGVDFRIDEDGGSSTKPITPRPLSPLQGQEELPSTAKESEARNKPTQDNRGGG